MNVALQGLLMVSSVLFTIYLLTIMTRFSIVSQRKSFFNPLYNTFYKMNQKPIGIFEKLLPKTKIDFPSLVYAYFVATLIVGTFCAFNAVISPLIFVWGLISLFSAISSLCFFGVLIIVLASWIAPNTPNPSLELVKVSLEPLLGIFKKIIPNFGGLDLSPIGLILFLMIFDMIIINVIKAQVNFPTFLTGF